MKILFVSAVLPYPLHSGGQIRIYNLLKKLSKKHDIILYAFIRSNDEKKYISQLSFCKKVVTVLRGRIWQPKYFVKTLLGSYSLLWSSYDNSLMRDLISQETYDLVHIEPGYVYPSLPKIKTPLVVSEHNIEHDVYEAYLKKFPLGFLLFFDSLKMRLWEARVWKQAQALIAVSQKDKQKMGAGYVVQNGVDLETFTFRPKKTLSKNLVFLYVGNFRWMENKDAAKNIIENYWPAIKRDFPNSKLRIVGKGAPDGEVVNIADEFHRADILLAPIRVGGGTKYKILEAMACGLPVITTDIGIEGLDPNAVLVAQSPQEAIQSIYTLEDNATRLSLVKRARSIIETSYSWETRSHNG